MQTSTPPMAGSFSANFTSRSSLIPSISAESSSDEFAALLSSVSRVGEVFVENQINECFEKKWLATWTRANGHVDFPTLDLSRMTGQNVVLGDSLEVSRGGLVMNPIPSNHLNKAFSSPVVEVTVNSVPSLQNCDFNSDCLIGYSTPTHSISALSVSPLSTGQNVNLQGANFDSETIVYINSEAVFTSFIDSSNLQFTVQQIQDNNFVQLWSPALGFSEKFMSEGSAIADSLSRNDASFGGFTVITVSGSGFDQGTTVKFDSVLTSIDSFSYSEIVFSTPKTENSFEADVQKTVIVENSRGDILGNFLVTLKSDITPTVDSISSQNSAISGSEISVYGSGLDSINSVFVGSESCEILNSTVSELLIKTPVMTSGDYSLQLLSENGAAFMSSQISINYNLSVISISPENPVVSALGGGLLTISGSGFEIGKTEVLVNGKSSEIAEIRIMKSYLKLHPVETAL